MGDDYVADSEDEQFSLPPVRKAAEPTTDGIADGPAPPQLPPPLSTTIMLSTERGEQPTAENSAPKPRPRPRPIKKSTQGNQLNGEGATSTSSTAIIPDPTLVLPSADGFGDIAERAKTRKRVVSQKPRLPPSGHLTMSDDDELDIIGGAVPIAAESYPSAPPTTTTTTTGLDCFPFPGHSLSSQFSPSEPPLPPSTAPDANTSTSLSPGPKKPARKRGGPIMSDDEEEVPKAYVEELRPPPFFIGSSQPIAEEALLSSSKHSSPPLDSDLINRRKKKDIKGVEGIFTASGPSADTKPKRKGKGKHEAEEGLDGEVVDSKRKKATKSKVKSTVETLEAGPSKPKSHSVNSTANTSPTGKKVYVELPSLFDNAAEPRPQTYTSDTDELTPLSDLEKERVGITSESRTKSRKRKSSPLPKLSVSPPSSGRKRKIIDEITPIDKKGKSKKPKRGKAGETAAEDAPNSRKAKAIVILSDEEDDAPTSASKLNTSVSRDTKTAHDEENEAPQPEPPQPPPSARIPSPKPKPSPSARSQSIAARSKSTPMSELIRRVNSLPGSPFAASPRGVRPGGALAKGGRSVLMKIAPLHPNRRTPPPPPPPPPKPKKTKKQLQMEERWEEELSESVEGWAAMTDEERAALRRAKRDAELGVD